MNKKLFAALVGLSLIWGASFYFIKVLLDDFGPWSIAMLRSIFGAVVLLAVMLLLRQPLGVRQYPWLPLIFVGLFNTAVPWALIGWSETEISSSMASVLNATTPLWTLLVGLFLFQGKAAGRQWGGMAIGFLGLLILLKVNPVTIISVNGWAVLAMLAATLCYGISGQISRRYLGGMSVYQISLSTLLIGCVGSGIAAFAIEGISFAPLASPHILLMLAGLGGFGSGIAYLLFYFMIQRGSAEFASLVTYLVPVTAILWGYLLLAEPVEWNLLAGLVCILAGVYLAGSRPANVKQTEQQIAPQRVRH